MSIAAIAAATGTPVYVYSANAVRDAYRALERGLTDTPHAIHYALKANSTLAIARLLRTLGSGADANSGGEIEVALRAGFIPPQVVFTGVGKTRDELERAVTLGVKTINVESAGEIERIDAVARAVGARAPIAIRVNPDIDAQSHPHISTGRRIDKFGIPLACAVEVCRAAARRAAVAIVGVHVHIGSQLSSLDPIGRAVAAAVDLARELRSAGLDIEHVDVGGGLGIPYTSARVPTIDEYTALVASLVRGSGLTLLLEPGRVLLGPAGVLVARIVDVKPRPGGGLFVVLDAGMTELVRPALYGAYHHIEAVASDGRAMKECEIVGPLCESSDTFGTGRVLPDPRVDDLVAIRDAGAYGLAMASTYNRRAMPPEALVDGGAWRLIRRRQTIDEMLSNEE